MVIPQPFLISSRLDNVKPPISLDLRAVAEYIPTKETTMLSDFIESAAMTLDNADLEFEPLKELADEMLAKLEDIQANLKEIVSSLEEEDAQDAMDRARHLLS